MTTASDVIGSAAPAGPALAPRESSSPPSLLHDSHTPGTPSLWPWFIALMGWTVFLSFWHLRGGPALDPMDCWVAQTAREMRQAGDWLIPRFSGEVRLQKSPGAYWAVMLASMLRGQPIDEVAAKLPDATAIVVLVGAIFLFTRAVAGDRPAIFAGFAAASSTLCLGAAHKSSSDVGLMMWVAVALMSWWCAANLETTSRRRGALWCLGYLAAGIGMLWKMPMPLVCVGLPGLVYMTVRLRWRVLLNRWHLLGLVLFLLPWLPWVIAVLWTEPEAIVKWRAEVWDRFTGDLPNVQSHHHWKVMLLYIPPLFINTLPYALSLPGAVVRAFRAPPGRTRDGLIFCVIWVASLVAFFTISVGKAERYLLPALPPLFVLLGVELAAVFSWRSAEALHRIRWLIRGTWLLVPGVIAVGFWGLYVLITNEQVYSFDQVWPAAAVTAAIFALGSGLSIWLYQRARPNASFAALVGTMWLTWLYACPNLLPRMFSLGGTVSIGDQLLHRLPESMRPGLRFVSGQDPRLVWRTDLRIPRVLNYLELLRRENGKRVRSTEEQIIGEEMIRLLSGREPVLLISPRPLYIRFMIAAPLQMPEGIQAFPRTYLWMQSQIGRKDDRLVVFGNTPPPWPEPMLSPPSALLSQRD